MEDFAFITIKIHLRGFNSLFQVYHNLTSSCHWLVPLTLHWLGRCLICPTSLYPDHWKQDWDNMKGHKSSPFNHCVFTSVFFVLLCFCSTGVWTQSLALARQVIYHLSHTFSPVLLFLIHLFYQPKLWFIHLLLLSSMCQTLCLVQLLEMWTRTLAQTHWNPTVSFK
jgi:hypothetical protein